MPGPARSPEPSRSTAPRPSSGRPGGMRPAPSGSGGPRGPRRLTAVGGAVVTLGATFLGGAVDYWLFDGVGILMGLVYVVASFQVAIRVRPLDLAAAPISGPIAFAITLAVLSPAPGPGLIGHAVGLATALALQAGWLFTGTLVSVVITLARHLALSRARRRAAGHSA